MLWNAAFVPSSVQATLVRWFDILRSVPNTPIADGTWCPLSRIVAEGWSRQLILTALGLVRDIFWTSKDELLT